MSPHLLVASFLFFFWSHIIIYSLFNANMQKTLGRPGGWVGMLWRMIDWLGDAEAATCRGDQTWTGVELPNH